MVCDYTLWLGRIRDGLPAERRCLEVDGCDYLIGPVVESLGMAEVSTVRTIDFADPQVREVCERYLLEQYLGAAALYPLGPVPAEPALTPVLMVEFPAGKHEAVVHCCSRFGITDGGLLCDPLPETACLLCPKHCAKLERRRTAVWNSWWESTVGWCPVWSRAAICWRLASRSSGRECFCLCGAFCAVG